MPAQECAGPPHSHGEYDDQVDALGLIGQLLDRITAGQKPKPPDEKKIDPCREMFDETRECSFKLL
jgi:hypothetical protein